MDTSQQTLTQNSIDNSKLHSKYRRNGTLWLVLPFISLVIEVILRIISSFAISNMYRIPPPIVDTSSKSLIPTNLPRFGLNDMGGFSMGVAHPADAYARLADFTFGLLATVTIIFILVGIVMVIINFTKAHNISIQIKNNK